MAAFFTAIGAGAMVLLMHEIASHWMGWSKVRKQSPPKQQQQRREIFSASKARS